MKKGTQRKKKRLMIPIITILSIIGLLTVGVAAQWPHPEIVPVGTAITLSPEKDDASVGWLNLYHAGLDWEKGEMELTVTGAHVFHSYEEAGISPNDLSPSYVGGAYIPDNSDLLLLDMEWKNIDAVPGGDPSAPFYHMGVLRITEPAFFDGLTALGFSTDAGQYEVNGEIAYFSHHAEIDQESPSSDYLHYNLNNGETMRCQIAWWIPKNMLQNNEIILKIGNTNMYKYGVRLDNSYGM